MSDPRSSVKSHICFLTFNKPQPQHPLFIFLPGMDGTGRLLRTQTAGLKASFDVRCLAIPPDDLTDWDVLTDKVIALVQAELDKSDPQRPVYLCGESFGGCLALKMILRSPELFERLILVNPASSFHRKSTFYWGSQYLHWLPEPVYHFSATGFMLLLASLGRVEAPDRHDLLEILQNLPQKTSLWRLRLLREFAMHEAQLQQITQPVLVVASAADRLLPSLSEAQRLVQIFPQAQMVTLPNSGHACLIESDINLFEIMRSQNFLGPEITQHREHVSLAK